MYSLRIKKVIALVALLGLAGLAQASVPTSPASFQDTSVDLPTPACDSLQVPDGNRLAYHAYAVGVQSYRWNGTAWVFVEPVATLFADPEYHSKVGVHYLGPTWEGNSGGKVVAAKDASCTPNPTAVPWLRLKTVTAEGPGLLGQVTYIQRVNTTGGLTPTSPGTQIGAVAQIPYTAEYFFYRAAD